MTAKQGERVRFVSSHEGVHIDGIVLTAPVRFTCLACHQERVAPHFRPVLAVGVDDVGEVCFDCQKDQGRQFTVDEVLSMVLRLALLAHPGTWPAPMSGAPGDQRVRAGQRGAGNP